MSSPPLSNLISQLKSATFYFDLGGDTQSALPSMIRLLQQYGAKHSEFLDKTVTHLVTDKARTIAESSSRATKWQMAIWSVQQFIQNFSKLGIVKNENGNVIGGTIHQNAMNHNDNAANAENIVIAKGGNIDDITNLSLMPLEDQLMKRKISPTLQKVASGVLGRKRDLSQVLEEEKKKLAIINANGMNVGIGGMTMGLNGVGLSAGAANGVIRRAITPIYAAANSIGAAIGGAFGIGGNVAITTNVVNKSLPPTSCAASKKPSSSNGLHFVPFQHSYLLINEMEYAYQPLYKEYAPSSSGKQTFPVLHWDSVPMHCPFIPPQPGQLQQYQQMLQIQNHNQMILEKEDGKESPRKMNMMATKKNITEIASLKRQIANNNNGGLGKNIIKNLQQQQQHRKPPSLCSSVTAISVNLDNNHNQSHNVKNNNNSILQSQPATVATAQITTASRYSVNRPKPGYCECCCEKYSDMDKHVKSDFHRQYANDRLNYACVDVVIVRLGQRTDKPKDLECISLNAHQIAIPLLSPMKSENKNTAINTISANSASVTTATIITTIDTKMIKSIDENIPPNYNNSNIVNSKSSSWKYLSDDISSGNINHLDSKGNKKKKTRVSKINNNNNRKKNNLSRVKKDIDIDITDHNVNANITTIIDTNIIEMRVEDMMENNNEPSSPVFKRRKSQRIKRKLCYQDFCDVK